MKTGTSFLPSAIFIFKQYKNLADKAIGQLTPEMLTVKPDSESNSISIIMKHLSGNMLSRWTDFLTTDGEKPWRNRDSEFEEQNPSFEDIVNYWEDGWNCLFATLNGLSEADLATIVTIRGEEHSVFEAIQRQIAHYAYHVGQIVYVAKLIQSDKWQTLSIAKGQSLQFNTHFNQS
jgi:hypothetical protein